MSYPFTASIVKEGKWYVARAIEFGVVSQGKTLEEAKANLEEAVELYLEDEPELTQEVPKQKPIVTVLEAKL